MVKECGGNGMKIKKRNRRARRIPHSVNSAIKNPT
jgi:hypothetical protein